MQKIGGRASPSASQQEWPFDVIVDYAGTAVVTSVDLPRRVAITPVGSDVEVGVLREGKRRTVNVTVAEMPQAEQSEGLSSEPAQPRRSS